MRVLFILAALSVGVFFAGCTTIPDNPNLTGAWQYKITNPKTEKSYDGRMVLQQNIYDLKGKANDAFGEFTVTGNIQGPKFNLDCIKTDKKLTYKLRLSMTSEDSFTGTITTSSGHAGTIEGKRVD